MKKKIRDGSLYFRQKDILRPAGAVMLVVGLVWFYFGMSAASYYVPCVITPLGLILFVVGSAKIISDNDMAEQVAHAMTDYDKSVTDMDHFDRVVLKQPASVETDAYGFDETARYFKKAKNGTPISDRYTRSHLFFTKDSLLVVARTVSICELSEVEGAGITDLCEHYLLAAIKSAVVEEHRTAVTLSNTKKPFTVKWYELVLSGEEGELLRIPVRNDMDVSNLCETLNRRIG